MAGALASAGMVAAFCVASASAQGAPVAAHLVGDAVTVVGAVECGGAGLGNQDVDSCFWSFQAETRDGIVGHGLWRVTVHRNGRTLVYGKNVACMPFGTIQPGDIVDIRVMTGGLVEVGNHSGCGEV